MGKYSEILRKAREAGGTSGGQKRAEYITLLLNDVVGRPYGWTPDQCARFFETLLRRHVESEYLEQLLADSGFGAEFVNIRTISKRHDYLIEKNPEKYRFDKTTLRKRGTGQIDRIAEILKQDVDFAQTKQLLASVLSDAELEQLRMAGIVLTVAPDSGRSSLKRSEKVSNIGAPDGQFVGRADLLQALCDGFKEGCHIQLIGGADGWGKSRVALEYAQRHASEYQIICWINAWHDNCIISSIVSFFNAAKVSYTDALPGGLAELFRSFFDANRDWLIVFDGADLKLSFQQDMLKKYIPSGEGHIIITGNFSEQSKYKDSKYYLLDRLNEKPSDSSLLPLSELCIGQPLPMTLISSYIRESSWVDAGTYLHMLEDRCIGAEKSAASRIDEAAFEIKMDAVHIRQKYYNDPISVAVQQFLLISAICNPLDLDLPFLSAVVPIFPDPLGEICIDKSKRRQLIEALKGFGIFEIREGALCSNNWLNTLSHDYFSAAEQNDMCCLILSRMEKSIVAIRENQYTLNSDALIALIRPHINQSLRFMHWCGFLTDDEVAQRYPNACEVR